MKRSIRYDRTIIDSLRGMAVFAKVIEAGSFKKAADALALSPSVVSHHISHLEERVGKPLIYRNTRNLSLTTDGYTFLESAQNMLASAVTGFDDISSRTNSIAGELRVAMPTALSRTRFLNAIRDFEKQYPKIILSLSFSDRFSNHIQDGYDVALIFGEINNSSLSKRKLTSVNRMVIASEDYLKTAGVPKTPDQLKNHTWIWLKTAQQMLVFNSSKPAENPKNIIITPRMFVDNSMACRRLALEGMGLTVIPDFVVEDDLNTRRLVHILPEWKIKKTTLFATWPKTATRATLTHIFVDFMSENLAPDKTIPLKLNRSSKSK